MDEFPVSVWAPVGSARLAGQSSLLFNFGLQIGTIASCVWKWRSHCVLCHQPVCTISRHQTTSCRISLTLCSLFHYYLCRTCDITSFFCPLMSVSASTDTHTHTKWVLWLWYHHSNNSQKQNQFCPRAHGLLCPTIPPCLALMNSCRVPSSSASLTGNESLGDI